MRSASTIPYQLRPNKAIERNLFVELLKKLQVSLGYNLSTYQYIGFGAPFLEDFKQMHYEFDIKDMVCLEYDKAAYLRQKFNLPYKFIDVQPISSTDYIQEGNITDQKNCLIWLDYATPSELKSQLEDLELITPYLKEGDILKFTFNSNPKAYADAFDFDKDKKEKLNERMLLEYMQKHKDFAKYLPVLPSNNTVDNNFGGLLRTMGCRAIDKGLEEQVSAFMFLPISAFQYSDGQSMTTVTGIVINLQEEQKLFDSIIATGWPFLVDYKSSTLLNKHKIEVPSMTAAERMEIEKKLPFGDMKELVEQLPFRLDSVQKDNLNLVESYCRFYKYLPFFAKVTY